MIKDVNRHIKICKTINFKNNLLFKKKILKKMWFMKHKIVMMKKKWEMHTCHEEKIQEKQHIAMDDFALHDSRISLSEPDSAEGTVLMDG